MGAVMLRPGKKTQWVSSSLAKIILRHLSSRHLAYNFRGGYGKCPCSWCIPSCLPSKLYCTISSHPNLIHTINWDVGGCEGPAII